MVPPVVSRQGYRALHPVKPQQKIPFPYDKALYRQRHRVENLFAKLKDWRRIATRYGRCTHTFFSAICIAATIFFWINESWP
ncbi:transposase [Ensifer canadensis]